MSIKNISSAFFLSLMQVTASMPAHAQMISGNIFQQDQVSYGNWSPVNYLNQGWSGYHIIVRTAKVNNFLSVGSGDYKYTIGPFCPDGDCRYRSDVTILKLGGATAGQRSGGEQEVLGLVKQFDDGAIEQTLVQMPNGVNIARYDETEAQSRLRFDEAQVVTFLGFDARGNTRELGHIEEADSPNMLNQPESVYANENGESVFLTTVLERMSLLNESTQESVRKGTYWCTNDEHAVSSGWLRAFYSDSFDFTENCGAADMPMASGESFGARLKQFFVGRGNSTVQLKNPSGSGSAEYVVKSDVSFWAGNGTDYIVWDSEQNYQLAYISSEVLQSMDNCAVSGVGDKTICNSPKLKFLELNRENNRRWKHQDDSNQYISTTNPSASALIAYEVTGEIYTQVDGTACNMEQGDWSAGYVDSSLDGLDSEQLVRRCNASKAKTIHIYVLFPPGGDRQARVAELDRVLAMMPDQAQQSTELSPLEEHIDQIRALEAVRETGNPGVLDLALLVDLNTEEDHLTAQNKAWDVLSDLGVVTPRSNRPEQRWGMLLPESQINQPPTGASDDL